MFMFEQQARSEGDRGRGGGGGGGGSEDEEIIIVQDKLISSLRKVSMAGAVREDPSQVCVCVCMCVCVGGGEERRGRRRGGKERKGRRQP